VLQRLEERQASPHVWGGSQEADRHQGDPWAGAGTRWPALRIERETGASATGMLQGKLESDAHSLRSRHPRLEAPELRPRSAGGMPQNSHSLSPWPKMRGNRM